MKIGLLFGSFNPIHIGHVAIAKYFSKQSDLEQVWLVVSPQNPLKERKSLADGKKRLAQVKEAIGKNSKIQVCDIEFKLPLPSYTIRTLQALKKIKPKHEFVLIIGSDNLSLFHKWKDYKKILSNYRVYVYPRNFLLSKRELRGLFNHRNIKIFEASLLNVSSTFIREQMKKRKDVRKLVP